MTDETERSPLLLTTSLPYVNAAPHLGHALEFVQADAQARLHRLLGRETFVLTGTDDNSLKNVLAAEREGAPVADFVERNAARFRALGERLGLAADGFVRTSTDARHRAGVARIWTACARAGDLYRRPFRGLYCVGCEQFYTADELADGRCREHGTAPELVEEDNWFFRLSRYQRPLLELLDSGRLRVTPETRAREARAHIAAGLQDISVSRTRARARGWGIAVPGDADQVVYVWLDALANYVTGLGYAEDAAPYQRYWCAPDGERVHLIGKGILRFHAVYWPAFLLSAGLPTPSELRVHGYLTVEGRKIGKSLGNAVDPEDLIARYGPEAVRYWLLRAVSGAGDADFREAHLAARYNADLANDLGNLVQRTLGLLHRYRSGVVPAPPAGARDDDRALFGEPGEVLAGLRAGLATGFDPPTAVAAVFARVDAANRFVDARAPWTLARAERLGDDAARGRLDAVLYDLCDAVRLVGEALRPLLPATADAILAQLGVSDSAPWTTRLAPGRLAPGTAARDAVALFPRR